MQLIGGLVFFPFLRLRDMGRHPLHLLAPSTRVGERNSFSPLAFDRGAYSQASHMPPIPVLPTKCGNASVYNPCQARNRPPNVAPTAALGLLFASHPPWGSACSVHFDF